MTKYYFFALVSVFLCCKGKSKSEKQPATAVSFKAPVMPFKKIGETVTVASFVPPTYKIRASAKADLNRDSIEDVVLVLEHKALTYADQCRRVYVLTGIAKSDQYRVADGGDKVGLCAECGGATGGDPFNAVTASNGKFTIEQIGGSKERWNFNITFEYDAAAQKWFLDRVVSNKNKNNKQTIKTTVDLGKVALADYDVDRDK
ncbi:MAG: hypothetical protein RLZZ628_632 [Bacteroidota bacterium]|jgi:hypothetical protein